jgi:hypothetical protein
VCATQISPGGLALAGETRIPDEHYSQNSKVHNAAVGHMGVNVTLDRLRKDKTIWPKMRKHISQFIRQCPACQKMNERKLVHKMEPYTTAAYQPMEVLNVDTVGPIEGDSSGNEHILVIIDCFSRWVELVAIPTPLHFPPQGGCCNTLADLEYLVRFALTVAPSL